MLAKLSESRFVRFFGSDAVALAFKIAYLLLAFLSFNSLVANMPPVTYAAYAVVAFGFLVLVARIIDYRRFVDMPFLPLLALFLVSFAVSGVFSARYGIMENVQGFVWLTLEFCCLYTLDLRTERSVLMRDLKVFASIFIAYTFIASLVGIYMGLANYQDGYEVRYMVRNIVGIFQGRLYGLYSDPNYGAVYGLISILFSWWIFVTGRRRMAMTLAVSNTLVQIFYIGLTGSRTGVYGAIAVALLLSFLAFMRLLKARKKIWSNSWLRGVFSCILSLIVAVGIFGCFKAVERIYLAVLPVTETNLSFPIPDDYLNDNIRIYESPKTIEENSKEVTGATNETGTSSEGASSGVQEAQNSNNDEPITQGVGSDKVGLSARVDVEGDDISNGRFDIWESALEVFASSPLVGTSHRHIAEYAADHLPDTYIVREGFTTMHNVFMDILAGQGILGFVTMAAFIGCIARILVSGLIRQCGLRYFQCLMLIGVLFSIAFSSLFYSEILYINTVGSVVFWVVLGVLVSLFSHDGANTFFSNNARNAKNEGKSVGENPA